MKFETFPFNTFQSYFSADVMALYEGKWLLCMHKERTTWEHPSGWIEEGETPLEAAKRELYEETGAVAFDMEPLCDYYIDGELGGYHYNGNGQVYFAIVHTLEEIPSDSEMEKIGLFDSLPDELTYPILRDYFEIAVQKKQSKLLLDLHTYIHRGVPAVFSDPGGAESQSDEGQREFREWLAQREAEASEGKEGKSK